MKTGRKLNPQMEKIEPENTARMVVDTCSDCDVCRFLMDSDCLMFPALYRLYDKETFFAVVWPVLWGLKENFTTHRFAREAD
jgi:hypothetical protein